MNALCADLGTTEAPAAPVESTQRPDVAAKYEAIYEGLALLAGQIGAHDYQRLRQSLAAAWSTFSMDPRKYRPWLAEPVAWAEEGISLTGTRATWLDSYSKLFARAAAEHIAPETDLLIDLGCGIGHRMVDLHRAGVKARFAGGDLSRYSEALTRMFATMFPAMAADWFRFDFTAPDFHLCDVNSKTEPKRVVVFTCHAIEQVRRLGPATFDAVFKRFPDAEIAGIHLEPVSWQIDLNLTREREYATLREYNADLMDVLEDHKAIAVRHTEPVIYRQAGDWNPTSLVVWEKRA